MRPTDHARRALRRAQLLLGALAVAVAVPVGVAAASSAPAPPTAVVTVPAELLAPAPAPEVAVVNMAVPTTAHWSTPDGETVTGTVWAEAGLAQGAVVAVVLDAVGRPVEPAARFEDPAVTGSLAGAATLVTCWGLLGLGLAASRARLAALDSTRWAADWARVEPIWSGRSRL